MGNFLEKVDYVIPLTVRRVDGEGEDHTGWAGGGYTREEIAELQGTDAGVGMVKRWVEAGGEPQREELMLARDPDVLMVGQKREMDHSSTGNATENHIGILSFKRGGGAFWN